MVSHLQEPHCHRIGIFASNTHGISGGHPQELLQKHQDVITREYPHRSCVMISGDLHCVLDDRIEAPFWIGSGVLEGSVQRLFFLNLPHTGFPSIKCSLSIHCPGSVSTAGPDRLPDKVTWPTSTNHGTVIAGNPRGLDWHPRGKNYSSDPIHVTEMESSAWSTRFVIKIIDFATLNGLLCRAKCHYKLLCGKWWFMTDCWFNPYKTISLDSFYTY